MNTSGKKLSCKFLKKTKVNCMKKTSLCVSAVIAVLLLLNTGCSEEVFPSEFSQEGCLTDTSKAVAKPVYSINVFVETSGSMNGFMPSKGQSATKFQDDMWELISKLSQKYPKEFAVFQLKAKNESPVRYEKGAFRNHLNSGRFQMQTSTDIPEMIDSILTHTGSSQVSVLISDLIFSPEDASKARLDQVDTDISSRFAGKGLASAIFHFTSGYFSKSIRVESSPYYVWVIGSEDGVKSISETIRQTFPDLNELSYGTRYKKPDYSLLPGYSAVTNAIPLRCTVDNRYYTWMDYDATQGNKIEFTIAVDFSHLPSFARDSVYLKANLKPVAGNAEIISVGSVEPMKNKTDVQLVENLKATHLIRVRAKNIVADDEVIILNLKNIQPKWYTTVDAAQDDKERKKTFGLSKMISGLDNAYDENEFLINEPIKVLITKKSK